jgi:membrane protein implicated in regulation of membrane protease activity
MRWTVVVVVWLVAYGAAAVAWRAMTGKTWLDALVFAIVVAVVNVVAQWVAGRAKRKAAARGGRAS